MGYFTRSARWRFQPCLQILESRLAPATFTVTNLNDDGAGSLRRAVDDANFLPGADTINFAPSASGTIVLTTGAMDIEESLSIEGPGASKLTISGNVENSIFLTALGFDAGSISIQGLTFTQAEGALYFGDGTITVRQCRFVDNKSEFFDGGAIYCRDFSTSSVGDVTLLVEDCEFVNNSARQGSAIYCDAPLTIRRSSLSGNTSHGTNLGYDDGGTINVKKFLLMEACAVSNNVAMSDGHSAGLFVSANDGETFTILNSTISGNSTLGRAGAILVDVNSGSSMPAMVTIRNTTISGNTGSDFYGGVLTFVGGSNPVVVNIDNSTIANNQGGGIGTSAAWAAVDLTLNSTIVAGNKQAAPNTGREDFSFHTPVNVAGNTNLIGVMNAANNVTLTGTGNQTGTVATPLDAKLEALADNGGLTWTHALKGDSPALNNGNNAAGLSKDQRGFNRTFGLATDVGAFELVTGIIVTNTNDSGPGSLRQAVTDANAGVAGPISFGPLFFTPQTITLSSGQLVIQKAMEIIGPGPEFLTLIPTGLNRIMSAGVTPQFLNPIRIANMTFKNANHTGGASSRGGALHVLDEAVTVSNCVFENNTAASGGAIYVEFVTGYFTVEDCRFINNKTTTGSGGAIHINSGSGAAPITIRRSLVSGNSAISTGGGIFVRFGPVTIDSCTIAGNSATDGGGIYVTNTSGDMQIRNSTIANNFVTGSGGGIFTLNSTKTLSIYNSTIVDNSASTGIGGGIARSGGTASITIDSSIVSNNVNFNAPDVSSTGTVNVDFSAMGSSTGFTLTGSNNLPFGTDLKLGPLAYNGGPTPTHRSLSGSPAIDVGRNSLLLATDQRGGLFARNINGVDIGAFEAQGTFLPATVAKVQVNDGTAQRSRVTSLAVTLSGLPLLPLALANAFELKRQSDNAIVTMNASAVGNVVTLTFTGGAVDFGSLADGRYTLTVLATQITNLDGDGNGTVGDDYALVGSPGNAPNLFRLFGDENGDGTVAANDFIQFRLSLGGTNNVFDFDNDGAVAASDFIQFRLRFGGSI